jgi:hypothetical protein
VIGGLYPLLRKGGKWVVYEHVKTKYRDEFVGYFWQRKSESICLLLFADFLLTPSFHQSHLADFLWWL